MLTSPLPTMWGHRPQTAFTRNWPRWHWSQLQNCEKWKSAVLAAQSMTFCYNSPSRLRQKVSCKWRIREWTTSEWTWQTSKPNAPLGICLWSLIHLMWKYLFSFLCIMQGVSLFHVTPQNTRKAHVRSEWTVNHLASWLNVFCLFILPGLVGVSLHLEIGSTPRWYWRTGPMRFCPWENKYIRQVPIYFLLVSIGQSCRQEGCCAHCSLHALPCFTSDFFISSYSFIAGLHPL